MYWLQTNAAVLLLPLVTWKESSYIGNQMQRAIDGLAETFALTYLMTWLSTNVNQDFVF